jgi:tetratricopeptide (TPR) repeat protein
VPCFRSEPWGRLSQGSDLAGRVMACQAASLLTVSGTGPGQRVFVHRWTATELAARATAAGGPGLEQAHRQAAAYWRWRNQVWPQDKAADVHDLLEARHHLLAAGDTEDAGQVTEEICLQLDTWGAWDQEASLIHDTLARLPANSPRQAAWIHHLGILAQHRGDYDEAARQYQRALDLFERLGDQAGLAISYSQLGILEADRGGGAGLAIGWHVKALAIRLRLGVPQARIDLRRLAALRGELGPGRFAGLLAQASGDTGLAETITSLLGQLDAADADSA